MKPINPQDKPKVIAMLVATVLLFGFVLKTILGAMGPKDAPKPAANPAPPAVAVTSTPAPGTAPGTVPGAVPGGAVGTAPGTAVNPQASLTAMDIGGPSDPFRKVLPDPGRFQNPGPSTPIIRGGGPRPLTGNGGGLPPINPNNPGMSMTRMAHPEPSLRLDGIVADKENYAMVTVGSKTEMYRAGSRIANVFEVTSIDEFGASFRGPNGTFRLEVGQEHTQAAAPPPSNFDGSAVPQKDALTFRGPLLPMPMTGRKN
jgi:hypothetical protein